MCSTGERGAEDKVSIQLDLRMMEKEAVLCFNVIILQKNRALENPQLEGLSGAFHTATQVSFILRLLFSVRLEEAKARRE